MSIKQVDINGNPFVGVYCRANESFLFHPPGLRKRTIGSLAKTLDVRPVKLTVGGSTLIGSLVAMNSTGAVVSNMMDSSEVKVLKKELNVVMGPDRLNACGNNILCNDTAAMVHPGYTKKVRKTIGDVLGVEVVKGTMAGMRTMGSTAVAVNKGILCHPKASKEEMGGLRELFKVNVQIGTANYGSAMVGACIIANTKGALVGTVSTGIELGRIEDALGYLD